MKNIEYTIKKSSILDSVSLNTAYAGSKTEAETDLFERVATVGADDPLLSGFWADMCGTVTDTLQQFIAKAEISGDQLALTLEVSNSYDEALTPSVVSDLTSAITAGVSAGWFRYTLPSRAQEFETQSSELLKRVLSRICLRKRPIRP